MKPVYLEFCGINSFSEPAVIDFGSLLEYGIFGIFGDTGSGKSTILDCIGFALYGGVSRARTGSIAEIINYKSDKAYAIFEFEITFEGRRRRFRVERELKRKNAVQSVRVYEREGETLRARSEGVRESNALIERIVGLEQRDFEKCIALPQGEFAQFVRAQRSDRLKLVSRLFDLEEYGESLVKRANARCADAARELGLTEAKLEPYAQISEAGIEALGKELSACEAEQRAVLCSLGQAREREKRLAELFRRRTAREEAEEKLALLEREREEVETLEKELGRLSAAAAAVKAAEEVGREERALRLFKEALAAAEKERKRAEEEVKAFPAEEKEKLDEEIARLAELKPRAEQYERAAARVTELGKKLDRARRDYAAEAERYRGFSYEAERDAIEERLKALGEGTAFAEEHAKAALLRGEYAVFKGELEEIRAAFPETEEMTAPLIGKYGALSTGEKTDFSALRAAYEAREKEKETERGKLLLLEKKNGDYRSHRERLQKLQTEGVSYKEELAAAEEELAKLPKLRAEEIAQTLEAKKRERRERNEKNVHAREAESRAGAAFAAAVEKTRAAELALGGARSRFAAAMKEGNFSAPEEAEELIARCGDPETGKKRVLAFRGEYAAALSRKKEHEGEDLSEGTKEALQDARREIEALEARNRELLGGCALLKDRLAREQSDLTRKRELEAEKRRLLKKAELSGRLKKLLEGNKFMEFVAEEYLVNVAGNGSRRLLSLTNGRYFLRYEGGFLVGDNFDGGKTRGVYTLSGGETFLVSLSLALALSEEICLKSLRPIEFFFLDEGFGSLDERLVDTVLDSLEKLRGEHFSIGIISHVEELKRRIEKKITVTKATESHGSALHV